MGLSLSDPGINNLIRLAMEYNSFISLSIFLIILGLSTFTATWVLLSIRVPKWTWAIEALATGVSEKFEKISLIFFLNDISIISIAFFPEKGVTWSCKRVSSFANSS